MGDCSTLDTTLSGPNLINAPLSAAAVFSLLLSLARSPRYYVNRDTLFCYHKASEVFLQRLMALYVSSHYKVSGSLSTPYGAALCG